MTFVEKGPSSRQKMTARNNPEEATARMRDFNKLIDGLLGRHKEHFAEPRARLALIKDQNAASFFRIIRHINARLRGETPLQLAKDKDEVGASLMMLHTPSVENKPQAFESGYKAIEEYLHTTEDSIEEQLEKVSMAAEALIIWVHPFNDGNGRTSRFVAQFLESGPHTEEIALATVDGSYRPTDYARKYRSREGAIADAYNTEIMYDDDEREELKKEAEKLPTDDVAIYYSIQSLIEKSDWRDEAKRRFNRNKTADAA